MSGKGRSSFVCNERLADLLRIKENKPAHDSAFPQVRSRFASRYGLEVVIHFEFVRVGPQPNGLDVGLFQIDPGLQQVGGEHVPSQ